MGKLHLHHHHLIMTAIVLAVLIIGIAFGVQLTSKATGTEGIIIISFALSFLGIIISFLIFSQLLHIREHITSLNQQSAQKPLNRRKGQAAMEFMMTYGWAILVLIVMMGALAYFGVLNPAKVVPEKCVFGAGFNCKDFRVQEIGGGSPSLRISFSVENKLGDLITLQTVNVTTSKGGTTYAPLQPNCNYATIDVDSDNTIPLFCDLSLGVSNGDGQRQKFTVTLSYVKLGGTYAHTTTGEIDATITN